MEFLINSLGIFLLIIAIVVAITLYKLVKNKREIISKINNSWGRIPAEKYKTDDLVSIASYYNNFRETLKDSSIDDITWNDLDMDRVYKRLNYSHCSVGEECLYNTLRVPVLNSAELKERGRVIDYLTENVAERKKLQYFLESLGKLRNVDISNYIGEFKGLSIGNAIIYKGLAIINVICVGLTIYKMEFFMLLVISFFINMTVYYRAKNILETQLSAMGYIAKLINISKKIVAFNFKGIENYLTDLRECNKKLAKVGRASYGLSKDSAGDPLTEYIRIILLTDLNNYNTTLIHLKNNQTYYKKLYETIGFLDNMLSIASFRASLKYFCIPELSESYTDSSLQLKVTELYHPLIENPVANSINLNKSLLLTGSNASGKSTFLKSLALNAIFAQTIYTCLARNFESHYYIIMTSMALKDDLQNKESYFIAEIKSLKRILDKLNDKIPCLCFIDEILRGTNTIERIASSSRVLRHMSGSNALCVAATHDIELTRILEGRFENHHFRETVTDNDITFDYKLHEGRSETRNAIKLLKLLGFDETIVEDSNKAAVEFEEKGIWGRG